MQSKQKFLLSLGERVGATFVEAFLGTLSAGSVINLSQLAHVSVLEQAALAGTISVFALIKNLAGQFIGNASTPSWLPAHLDPATPPTPALPPAELPPVGVETQQQGQGMGAGVPPVQDTPYVHRVGDGG